MEPPFFLPVRGDADGPGDAFAAPADALGPFGPSTTLSSAFRFVLWRRRGVTVAWSDSSLCKRKQLEIRSVCWLLLVLISLALKQVQVRRFQALGLAFPCVVVLPPRRKPKPDVVELWSLSASTDSTPPSLSASRSNAALIWS